MASAVVAFLEASYLPKLLLNVPGPEFMNTRGLKLHILTFFLLQVHMPYTGSHIGFSMIPHD